MKNMIFPQKNYRLLNYVDFDNNITRQGFSAEIAQGWSAFAARISNYILGLGLTKIRDILYKECEAINMIKSCYAIYVLHQVKIEFVELIFYSIKRNQILNI
jgi:hypothetical protein